MIKFFIKIAILLSAFFSFIQKGEAQVTDLPKVSGLVLEKSTGSRLADVNIINLKTNRKVTTNNFGVFYIDAIIGDSLSISKVGYGALKLVLYTLDDVVVEMQPGMQIETVVVARKTRQQEMEDILRDYEKKGIYNGGKNKVGTYLNSPATALYNLFGREAKNMKRFEKYMSREINEIAVDRIFTKSIVTEHTGLEGESLQHFMEIYRPSYELSKNWGQYDLLKYIANSFKSWDEQGRPAPVKLPKLEIPPQN